MTADPQPPDGDAADADEEEPPWPVGFIVLVTLGALYIGWRVIQLIVRGFDWLF